MPMSVTTTSLQVSKADCFLPKKKGHLERGFRGEISTVLRNTAEPSMGLAQFEGVKDNNTIWILIK